MAKLTDIDGIGPATADELNEYGVESIEDLADADAQELTNIKNVTESNAQMFIVRAQDMLGESEADVDEEDMPDEDDVVEDLFPDTGSEGVSEEDQSEEEESVGELGNEPQEATQVSSEDVDESMDDEDTHPVSIDLDATQHDAFIHAVFTQYVKEQRRNHERADAMEKVLDNVRDSGTGTLEMDLDRSELNTLYSALRDSRSDLQGRNRLELMRKVKEIEDSVNDQRREYLF